MKSSEDEVHTACSQCGAPVVDGLDCWGQLGALLAWEWQDPELLAVHFLTMASYNLQHPAQFTSAALEVLRAILIAHLDEGVATVELRRRVAEVTGGQQRVLKAERARRPHLRSCSMTIGDVYLRGQPQGASQRVRAWAVAIRNEL
jgi:hypothetical protein